MTGIGTEVCRLMEQMRIHHGPGYRIYFITQGTELIVLLCAGDKGSQRRDIERAKRMAKEWRTNV